MNIFVKIISVFPWLFEISMKTREHKLKEAIVPTSDGFHEGIWPNMPREA